jgi:hypothetical protein
MAGGHCGTSASTTGTGVTGFGFFGVTQFTSMLPAPVEAVLDSTMS